MESSNEENVPIINKEEIDNLHDELKSLNFKYKDGSNKKNYEILLSLISEYLDSFILLGFSLEGSEVLVTKCDSPRDSRALTSLMDEVVDNMFDRHLIDEYDSLDDKNDED